MKKSLLSLLLSTILSAEVGFYTGAGYMYLHESLSEGDTTIQSSAAKIKIGYGVREAYAVEFSLNYIMNNAELLSPDDKEKYGFDIELMKAWKFNKYLLPFMRVGFGSGKMASSARNDADYIFYGSYNVSAGILVPLSKHFDLDFSYDYKHLSYQKLDTNQSAFPLSNQHGIYAGVNYRF